MRRNTSDLSVNSTPQTPSSSQRGNPLTSCSIHHLLREAGLPLRRGLLSPEDGARRYVNVPLPLLGSCFLFCPHLNPPLSCVYLSFYLCGLLFASFRSSNPYSLYRLRPFRSFFFLHIISVLIYPNHAFHDFSCRSPCSCLFGICSSIHLYF